MLSFQKSSAKLALFISFFAPSCLLAQNGFRIGIKAHPNISFSTISDKSQLSSDFFSSKNGMVGLNLGLCFNYQYEKWIFEITSGLKTNSTGLRFKDGDDVSSVTIRSMSLANEFNLGFRVFESIKPRYEIFALLNAGYNFIGIKELSGESRSSGQLSNKVSLPNLNADWNSVSIGTGIRIRAHLKSLRQIDYGLSYNYYGKQYPEIGLQVFQGNEVHKAVSSLNLHSLNIDFIYYFGKRKRA